jgi:hypothetical protein
MATLWVGELASTFGFADGTALDQKHVGSMLCSAFLPRQSAKHRDRAGRQAIIPSHYLQAALRYHPC